jgi:uncharacterized protein YkwD
LRKVAAAALAVPVIALLYLTVLLRRSIVARAVLAVGLAAVVAVGAIGLSRPAETTATPPSVPVPLTEAAFTTDLAGGQQPDAPITVEFSTPMDEMSVAAHLEVDPPTPVALAWDESRITLTVRPTGAWDTSRFHTVTVQAGALAETGRPLSTPVRAAFLTRAPTGASLVATDTYGERVRTTTAFELEFDHPVDLATLSGAFFTQPPIDGTFERVGRRTGELWRFTPTEPLALDTIYTLALGAKVRDAQGAPLADAVTLDVRTTAAPSVVRFRPTNRTTSVAWDQTLSVRFSEPMDRAATAAAFSATAGGKAVAGAVSWAENNTVLVFNPTANFGYSQKGEMLVSGEARSAAGVPLLAATSVSFTTAARPAPRPAPRTVTIPSGGGAIGSSGWAAVETYYLNLMNCTRTGGWVTSGGDCSSPGGRDVAPLFMDGGIQASVARPYAKMLAERNLCSHFIGGNPGDRLRAAGYTSYRWAENLGCRSGDPYAAVLGSHLFFQSEQSYSGGHYVNLMNAAYDRVGIGVWVSGGRVRLVVDFYHP